MNVTQNTVDYGLLSELAYLRLESDWFSTNGKDNKTFKDLKEFNNKETTGIDANRKQEIINLLSKYEILDFKDTNEIGGTQSGMQAMFVREISTGKKILLFRGTEIEYSMEMVA